MSTQPIPIATEPVAVPVTPPEPTPAQPYTSKYATRELAEAGIAEQDRYIAELRSQLAAQAPQAPAPAPSTTFYQALEGMVNAKSDAPLTSVLDSYIEQKAQALFDARFGAVTPLLSHAGLDVASQIAATASYGDPNIPAFVRSPAFQKAMNEMPLIKQGVEAFQVNGAAAREQLPQLIAMAYKMYGQPAAAPAAPAPLPARTVPSTTAPAPTMPAATTAGERWAPDDPRWNTDLREALAATQPR